MDDDATIVRFPQADERQIVAFGGGGFSMEAGNPLLDDYVLELARARRERPRICFLPTASGDADHYVVRFYRAFGGSDCEPSHVSLFRRDRGAADLREHLLSQDLIYVGGGSVISLLGTWRAHGIDSILAEAWRRGVILCGLSAGSLCWYSEGVTSFHGEVLRVRGLGLLPWSNCVHYGSKQGPREPYHAMLQPRACARATPPRTGAPCTSAARGWSRRSRRVRTRAPGASATAATGSSRRRCPTRYLGEEREAGDDELHAVA